MGLLTGCAMIRRLQARDTEELLTAAGFRKQLVDAADMKPLDAGPPYRLVSRTKDGTVQYTYADPDNCRCVLGSADDFPLPDRVSKSIADPELHRQDANVCWLRRLRLLLGRLSHRPAAGRLELL